jgi:ketol-acid reductoisomerase
VIILMGGSGYVVLAMFDASLRSGVKSEEAYLSVLWQTRRLTKLRAFRGADSKVGGR